MFGRSSERRGRGTGSLLRNPHSSAEATPLLGDDGTPRPAGFVAVSPGDAAPWHDGQTREGLRARAAEGWRQAAARASSGWQRQRFPLACGVLLIMTAAERITFKLAVDRMAPFRAFLAETVVFMYICICGALLGYKLGFTEDVTRDMWTFPQWKVAAIAAVDALHLFLMFVAGADISPAQTVLLLQLQVPLVTLVSGAVRCKCHSLARNHVLGSLGVLLSVFIAALSPLYFLSRKRLSAEAGTALLYSNVTYILASLPAAFSTVLKERAMIAFGRPVEPMLMNVMLGGYQMFFALLLSPLAFRLQSLGHGKAALPWDKLERTTQDGLHCWLLSHDPPTDRYFFDTRCRGAVVIILVYALAVLSLPSVAAAVLTSGSVKYVYRVVIVATGVSVLILGVSMGGHDGLLGTSIQPLELGSLVVLLTSLHLYHQEQEPDTEIITQYDHVAPQPA